VHRNRSIYPVKPPIMALFSHYQLPVDLTIMSHLIAITHICVIIAVLLRSLVTLAGTPKPDSPDWDAITDGYLFTPEPLISKHLAYYIPDAAISLIEVDIHGYYLSNNGKTFRASNSPDSFQQTYLVSTEKRPSGSTKIT